MRTAARRCCWNVEVPALVELFDVNGGAVVLLERRCASCWWAATMSTSTRLQLSDGVLRRERWRGGCFWNVEVSVVWVESFDVNGGAVVLLERLLFLPGL